MASSPAGGIATTTSARPPDCAGSRKCEKAATATSLRARMTPPGSSGCHDDDAKTGSGAEHLLEPGALEDVRAHCEASGSRQVRFLRAVPESGRWWRDAPGAWLRLAWGSHRVVGLRRAHRLRPDAAAPRTPSETGALSCGPCSPDVGLLRGNAGRVAGGCASQADDPLARHRSPPGTPARSQ